MAVDRPKNGDEAAIALLKWIAGALLLLNGAALALRVSADGAREALLDGSGWYHAGGLLCGLLGASCWAISYASTAARSGDPVRELQVGSSDQAVAFGAMAIMLWVASLTTFILGCEQVSWAPEHKSLHLAEAAVRVRPAQIVAAAPQAARP